MAMTVVLPFLPQYVEQLGISGQNNIVQWSGVAFSVTFITAGLVAPLWGYLGDRFGRKAMLIRASLGMAICMVLMALISNIWELIALRLIIGLAGGYSSGAMILVATQTPKERVGQALGLLTAGIMMGNLLGPLIGGFLPEIIGLHAIFLTAGALIFLIFLSTAYFVNEENIVPNKNNENAGCWKDIKEPRLIIAMLGCGLALMIANMSIEPILTVYVSTLVSDKAYAIRIAGIVLSASALGSIVSSYQLGKIADKIGYQPIVVAALAIASILLIPQAFVTESWQLIVLRFLMGLALGGLLPCIAAVIRHNVPKNYTGTVLGYSMSCQFAGQFLGPFMGGFVGGHLGVHYVFFMTSIILAYCALHVHKTSLPTRCESRE